MGFKNQCHLLSLDNATKREKYYLLLPKYHGYKKSLFV